MSGYHSRLTWRKKQHCLTWPITPQQQNWLFDSGSLTARLIKYCAGEFSVNVLSVKRAMPSVDEIAALQMPARNHALIREVLLCCNRQPLVYARTIIPVSSMRGALRGLAQLGNRPLGAVLFADKSMTRTPIEITSLETDHVFLNWMQSENTDSIWGRRSVFTLKGERLLVSEFFLPELFK